MELVANGKTRVAVNGYGVIGKRVAEALVLQDDMELARVADVAADWRMQVAAEKRFRIFAALPDAGATISKRHPDPWKPRRPAGWRGCGG